jgi:hypothetical protein
MVRSLAVTCRIANEHGRGRGRAGRLRENRWSSRFRAPEGVTTNEGRAARQSPERS